MSYAEKADAQAAASGKTPTAANGQLMDIGTVAAHNIALALQLPDEQVPVIKNAIRDEIQAMSSHFTLAVADLSTQYEIDVAKIKSAFTYVEANVARVAAAAAAVFFFGVGVGLIL